MKFLSTCLNLNQYKGFSDSRKRVHSVDIAVIVIMGRTKCECVFQHTRRATAQTSLRARAVWSEALLLAYTMCRSSEICGWRMKVLDGLHWFADWFEQVLLAGVWSTFLRGAAHNIYINGMCPASETCKNVLFYIVCVAHGPIGLLRINFTLLLLYFLINSKQHSER